jgi:ATP dependent DNA ligase domain
MRQIQHGFIRAARSIGFVPPCIPTRAAKPPAGPGWVHEIKHDGYRLQVRRVGDEIRLFTRRGYGWSGRYPSISVTARLLRQDIHAQSDRFFEAFEEMKPKATGDWDHGRK